MPGLISDRALPVPQLITNWRTWGNVQEINRSTCQTLSTASQDYSGLLFEIPTIAIPIAIPVSGKDQ